MSAILYNSGSYIYFSYSFMHIVYAAKLVNVSLIAKGTYLIFTNSVFLKLYIPDIKAK